MKNKRNKTVRKGSALLVVLLIVMAITILSLGFLSRSDVELACGENMILRTQMDYIAESGLEHARGLILNDSNYLGNWAVARQQLIAGSDYYDVSVDANGELNYLITCGAYREKDGERIGQSSLEAELRLDPCIVFWTRTGATIPSGVIINGDVYCGETLTNNGIINGDVFANGLLGSNIAGRRKTAGELEVLLDWPQVKPGDYSSYDHTVTDSNLGSGYTGVVYCPNDIELPGDINTVNIAGMLIVEGNLTITGSGDITADANLPALLVTGDLIIEAGGQLTINGLAVVNGKVQASGTTRITGGLFVNEFTGSGGNMIITAAPSKTAITTWPTPGNPTRWSSVAGAFFKSIVRL